MLSEAFTTMTGHLKGFISRFILKKGAADVLNMTSPTPATPEDIRNATMWLQKEKFLNLQDLEIAVPIGLNVAMMNYVKALEQVWSDYLVDLDDRLLTPLSSNIGMVANNEELAKQRLTIRSLNTKYPLFNKETDGAKGIISKCVNGGRIDRRNFGSMFNNATDYEATMLRVLALRDQVSRAEVGKITRCLETISVSVDTIMEYDVDPKLANHLSDELMSASKWIELYGVYILAIDELSNCLNATQTKIKSLSKNSRH